jgi:protein NirF
MIHRSYYLLMLLVVGLFPLAALAEGNCQLRGTGDLGLVIERASGSVSVVDTSTRSIISQIKGLGDLSHASAVFSRDARYAYVFGRDGGLSKMDLLCGKLVKRVVQAGNSIGGAISQDGSLIAVSNYKPGGVKVFDAGTLKLVADIPAGTNDADRSKVVGLVDAPGMRFLFSLYEGNAIWMLDMSNPAQPRVQKFNNIGSQPYDGLISPDGRYYIAGLFGEDGLALLDLWSQEPEVQRILDHYGRGEEKMPVYKMPHLEGWAMAGNRAFLPAVGHSKVLVLDNQDWNEVAQIAVHSQPVFVVARPDGRYVWVNFAYPHNDTVQVIDTQTLSVIKTLKPGKGVLHMEFSPRGENVWVSVRDSDEVQVYDTRTFEKIATLEIEKPSGIFFTARAHKTGL